jgi:hypothetical protein
MILYIASTPAAQCALRCCNNVTLLAFHLGLLPAARMMVADGQADRG